MSTVAITWDFVYRLSIATSGITPKVAIALEGIVKALSFPGIDVRANAPSRPLAFSCLNPKTRRNQQFLLPGGPIEFQLEHCGPYLDRAIDSAPDSCVRFEPDGWQRSVLDAIGKNQSLFVTAPTSAGKTFISFYAMEKVLQADDDGVLVYVAPTTALVIQIAAEIHGCFSENYKHAGRSVWAIHMRDSRINNPTGCQILKNSWSTRIKRIIFDEIHCIGQAKDGMVWKQLLLQAPCPIIALSATVGNPRQLSGWLSSTERANANDLVTVQHHYRYSNLRNFIYVPPKIFCFSGLPALPGIYIPGLDGSNAFAFVHPVASLVNKEKGLPSDLSLEARDCLHLWREAELKAVLRQWMLDDSSPFDLVRQDLASSLQHLVARDIVSTKQGCGGDCDHRQVDADDIVSMVLPVLVDLHAAGALPCIVFNYDRVMCEMLAHCMIDELGNEETAWKASKLSWQKKLADYHQWPRGRSPKGRKESDPPLNAYLLDFFKHGDIRTIEHVNKIQASEVWSRLKEFATILHTTVACLADLTKSRPPSNTDGRDIQSERYSLRVQQNGKMFAKQEEADSGSSTGETSVDGTANAENPNLNEDSEKDWYHGGMGEKGLLKVLRAFAELHGEFEAKLKKIAV
ncbi:hypothetical protein EDB80DRAFT_887549 [Ilyonectria destructans]|nr:hypothetical protein EDB80DRAFT_887549 [Ilyonectria destructans]